MRKSKLANRTSGGGTKYTIDQFSDSLGIVNNQKGFAISSMLYTILLLFLVLLMGVLGLLGTRKIILDKMKNEIATDINGQNKIVLKLDYRNALVANTSKVPNFSFVPTDIASVVDENGNKINGASISYDSKPTFDSTKNGSYTITYTGAYRGKSVTGTTTITVIDPVSYDYLYAPKEQVFKAPGDGLYQFQLWGAEGNASFGGVGGKGAYTSGNIPLTKDENIYVRIGGMMGYNGGGWTSALPNAPRGGGASDIRLDPLDRLDMISIGSVTECRASGGKMCITGTSGIVDTVTLGQNSVLYGPYKHYKAGIYLVTITGTHLDQLTYRPNISTEFAPDGVYHAFTFTPVTQLDTLYQYLLYLEKDYDNVELYMRNDTTTSATVEAVDIENIGSRIMVAAGGGVLNERPAVLEEP